MKKKLQVFISSTYLDLKEERQAAVEAILRMGHIPAGMELFTAGDQSQMNVIKQWIDESDVYVLLLGGRYGSLEINSQKSYTHLEYEYAIDTGKPYFAVVIDKKYLDKKAKDHLGPIAEIIEQENTIKLREFREFVESKIVRHWNSIDQLKIAIMEKLPEFNLRDDLVGWIKGSESLNSSYLLEEHARLTKENNLLKDQISDFQEASLNNISYLEIYNSLSNTKVETEEMPNTLADLLNNLASNLGQPYPNFIHMFWLLSIKLRDGITPFTYGYVNGSHDEDAPLMPYVYHFEEFGLVFRSTKTLRTTGAFPTKEVFSFLLSDSGKQFLTKLRVKGIIKQIENALPNTE